MSRLSQTSLLALLLSCGGGEPEPAGTGGDSGEDDGGDVGGDEGGGEGGDSGGSGGDDTGEPAWISLPADCTPPEPSGTDSFTLTGSVKNTQESGPGWFTEILDIAYLPDEDRVLTTGQGGLVVFDISDPTDPQTRGHVGAGGESFERYYQLLPVEPGLVWTTHREVGLDTFDVSDADDLVRLSRSEGFGYEGLARVGDHLYIASTEGHIAIFDVSEPRAPEWLGDLSEGIGRPWDVHAVGDVAYVADAELGLLALDLTDPAAPVVASVQPGAGQPVRLDDDGGSHLFQVSGAGGLELYELSDPLAPVLLATVDVGGSAQDVAYADGLVGVTTQEAVVLLDVGRDGSMAEPLPFAYEETEQFAMTLDALGSTWAVGDWNILGLWEAGEGAAPAGDLGTNIVAFLDEAETREVSLVNRGAAPLSLTGVTVPEGLSAQVSAETLAPGETGWLALTWDGGTELDVGEVCVATDDPDRPQHVLVVTSGLEGEGKVIGQAAPDFSLEDLDGETHRLSDQLGKPVVLAYFATW